MIPRHDNPAYPYSTKQVRKYAAKMPICHEPGAPLFSESRNNC